MEFKHKVYHATKGKVTKTIIIVCFLGIIFFALVMQKPIDWIFDRCAILALAYGFRRAM